MDPKRLAKLQAITDWELFKPSTDLAWAEDVKAESLHVKYDHQLQEMLESHTDKVLKVEKDLEIFTNWPDVKRYELTQQFTQMFEDQGNPSDIEGKTLQQWIDEEFESQQLMYAWKVAKLNQSNLRIAKEIELRVKGFLEVIEKTDKNDERFIPDSPESKAIRATGSKLRVPLGTTYYLDGTNGNAGNDGLSTGAAYLDLDNFTEAARSAGDILICRRVGSGAIDDGTDLLFTSDGTIANPIIIEADYANAFADDVDLSATATATLTFGSKTITFSADVSGVIVAGDWIYAASDDAKEFAYEVATVVTTTVTLFLPYKGNQAGSGKTMTNMQESPIWNTTAGVFQWNFDTDNYWQVQGIHVRGSDANGQIEIDSSLGHVFKDMIIESDGGGNDGGLGVVDDVTSLYIKKCRFFQYFIGLGDGGADGQIMNGFVENCLFDGNSQNFSEGLDAFQGSLIYISETEFKNHARADIWDASGEGGVFYLRNVILGSTVKIAGFEEESPRVYSEDHNNVIGDNRQFYYVNTSDDSPVLQSETTTVRTGGSNKSIKVTPTTVLNTIWDYGKIKIFELPIYATTDSKQYDIYFRPNATTDWTTDPTASELWIELEAWGHATNNFRKITKSTGVIDMNGSTAWQALSVTVASAQAGVAYLRCWYAKTKEAGSNVFFCDPVPVIS